MRIPSPNQARRGSATLVVLLLIALVFLYLNANVRTLHQANRHIRLVERKQVQRLERQSQTAVTNSIPKSEVRNP